MIYQKPQLLYALIAIAIPIIIHLFNLTRSKKINFSSNRLLKEVKEKNQKKSKLKNILLLISRILAISFLVFAFAKPIIPSKNATNSNKIIIYLDNSFSMDLNTGEYNVFNKAKKTAKEIAMSYSDKKDFYLVTNDYLSSNLSSLNQEEIVKSIEDVKISSAIKSIPNIISRVNKISKNNKTYIISDFQKNSSHIHKLKTEEINSKISFLKIPNINTDNIIIDSLFLYEKSSEINQYCVDLYITSNSFKKIENESIFLIINNKQKSQKIVNLSPKESKKITFDFIENDNKFICGEIQTSDNLVTYDNSFYFTYNKIRKANISIINNTKLNQGLETLFNLDTSLFVTSNFNSSNIQSNLVLKSDLVILNEVDQINDGVIASLQSYVSDGGSLLIIPPDIDKIIDFKKYNSLLEKFSLNTIRDYKEEKILINKLNIDNSIFKNVFKDKIEKINFPKAIKYYRINDKVLNTSIISFENNFNFLVSYAKNKGVIFQFTNPLNEKYNNFFQHALFVPTMINIARMSTRHKNYNIIGKNDEIILDNLKTKDNKVSIKNNNTDFIAEIKKLNGKSILDNYHMIKNSGIYDIVIKNKVINKIAFNAMTQEGNTDQLSNDEIKKFSKNTNNIKLIETKNKLKETIKSIESDKEYWKIFLIASLFFILLEIVILKLLKS